MLSIKEANSLLKNINFPGENDPTYSYCISKSKRKNAVQSRSKDCEIAAAIELQSAWRGHRARQKLRKIFNLESFIKSDPHYTKLLGSPNVKSRYKEYLHWCQEQGLDIRSPTILSFQDFCASIIQAWWRRHYQQGATLHSQKGGRRKFRRKLTPHSAAKLIQRKWRSYNDVKVFKFYRDLINFKGKGNPKMMLRCINPAEAKLLDRAAGAHVKFRLGGISFPPSIYYKVFTRRPIVDLCASSPRDYTAMSSKQKLPRELHNHTRGLPLSDDDKDNWYKRFENNGWRPVSDRLFSNEPLDPIAVQTSAQQKEFHYSKIKRKADVEKKRKQKKIDWLRKMYQEGMIQTHKELSSATMSAVHLATDQFMELSEDHPEMVDDEDVDELLSWTTALNFDQYTADWHLSGSTAFSDLTGDDQSDPYGLILTTPT